MASVTKLFDQAEIAQRVRDLASDIAAAISGEIVMVGLLKGSFVFMADLIRALDAAGLSPRIGFMTLSSYGHARESSGQVRLIGEMPADLAGRTVLLVDDIVDTGRSIAFAESLLRDQGVARVWTCALVDKPSRREVEFCADFVGFTVANVFVVGYGIDYAERYRHLPYIGAID